MRPAPGQGKYAKMRTFPWTRARLATFPRPVGFRHFPCLFPLAPRSYRPSVRAARTK